MRVIIVKYEATLSTIACCPLPINKKGHPGVNQNALLFIISPYSLYDATRYFFVSFNCDRKIKTNKSPRKPAYITIISNTQNHLI